MLNIKTLGFNAITPGHHGSHHRGDCKHHQQIGLTDRIEQLGKPEGREHRAHFARGRSQTRAQPAQGCGEHFTSDQIGL